MTNELKVITEIGSTIWCPGEVSWLGVLGESSQLGIGSVGGHIMEGCC